MAGASERRRRACAALCAARAARALQRSVPTPLHHRLPPSARRRRARKGRCSSSIRARRGSASMRSGSPVCRLYAVSAVFLVLFALR